MRPTLWATGRFKYDVKAANPPGVPCPQDPEGFDMTKPADAPTPTYKFFRGQIVWTGALFAVGAYIGAEVLGESHGFETACVLGGLFIGIGFERNRNADALTRSSEESK